MEYNCSNCNSLLIVTGGRKSRILNNKLAIKQGWQLEDGKWFCPDHKLKTYTFTATTNIEARTKDEAIDKFAQDADYFASKAECEILE